MGKNKKKFTAAVHIQVTGWEGAPSHGYEGTNGCADAGCCGGENNGGEQTDLIRLPCGPTRLEVRHDPQAHLVHKVAGQRFVTAKDTAEKKVESKDCENTDCEKDCKKA